MGWLIRLVPVLLVCVGPWVVVQSTQAATRLKASQLAACARKFNIDVHASDSVGWREPAEGSCHVQIRDGHRFPDPFCTPGALNPTATEDVLRSPGFTTRCIRNRAESESAKSIVFKWYGLKADSTCEKDHLVPLEVGGADTLDNIWPQCGPAGSKGQNRDFKQKDGVELYLGGQVKLGVDNGGISQTDARYRIINDWPSLLPDAGGPRPALVSRRARKTKSRMTAARSHRSRKQSISLAH